MCADRPGLAGTRPPHGAGQGLAAGPDPGLGSGRGGRGRVHLGGGGLRADRAPLAGARPTRGRAWGDADVRAAAAGRPGPGGRGLHPQQERRHRRDDHRPVGHRAALLPARAGRPGVGTAAPSGGAAGPAGRRGRRGPPAGPGSARVRLAGGARRRQQAAGLGELADRGRHRAGPGRRHRRAERARPARLGAVRRRRPRRACPYPLVLGDRAGGVRRGHRPRGGRGRRRRPARRGPWNESGSPWPTWPTCAPRSPRCRPG